MQENIWKDAPKNETAETGTSKSYYISQGAHSIFEQAAMPLHVMQEKLVENDNVLKSSSIEMQNHENGVDQIWPLGQIDRVFIDCSIRNSLYLIDQHAAHERILYDKL